MPSAKERLREAAEEMYEQDASNALARLGDADPDPMSVVLEAAPPDDEPGSAEEDESAAQALEDYRRQGGRQLGERRGLLSEVVAETDGEVFRDEGFIAHLERIEAAEDDLAARQDL